MKLKDGLILREVANQYIIVPVGQRVKEVHNMICISSSGVLLWEYMQGHESFTVDDLTEQILSYYSEVTEETARADIHKFLQVLRRNNLLEPEEGNSAAESGSVRIMISDDFE